MRDFPVFSTENGVGSLILKEIPYSGIAYIKIMDASEPDVFLQECLDFCRMAGAKCIIASGHDILQQYPFYTAIWRMSIDRISLPDTEAALFPVTEKTAQQWMQIYNDKMKDVPNSSYMSLRDMDKLVKSGDGYFVHEKGQLLGIGKASGESIEAVASVVKGAGKIIVAALSHALQSEHICLEVASVNKKAVALYEALGFVRTCEISQWYRIE